jgi:hypothetical protein
MFIMFFPLYCTSQEPYMKTELCDGIVASHNHFYLQPPTQPVL